MALSRWLAESIQYKDGTKGRRIQFSTQSKKILCVEYGNSKQQTKNISYGTRRIFSNDIRVKSIMYCV